jgi:DNA-binding response OmpR family regulator
MFRIPTAHLLAVDADPRFACCLRISLQEMGFVVHMACDEREALAAWQRLPIDVVLVDSRLFESTRLALCPTAPKRCQLPIIVLSASRLPDDMISAYLAGADDYIVKPFSLREVTARILRLVERPLSL